MAPGSLLAAVVLSLTAAASAAPPPPPPATVVSIAGTTWQINSKPTHAGSAAEGLLPNARMIQGIFDDANNSTRQNWAYPDTKAWDPERNTKVSALVVAGAPAAVRCWCCAGADARLRTA